MDGFRDPPSPARGRLPPNSNLGCFALCSWRSVLTSRLPNLLPGPKGTRIPPLAWEAGPVPRGRLSARCSPRDYVRVPGSNIVRVPLRVTLATNGGSSRTANRQIAGRALTKTAAISSPLRFPAVSRHTRRQQGCQLRAAVANPPILRKHDPSSSANFPEPVSVSFIR